MKHCTIFIISLVIMLSCNTDRTKSAGSNLVANLQEEYSEIDFLDIKECCGYYQFTKGSKYPNYTHNNKDGIIDIFFIGKSKQILNRWQTETNFDRFGVYNEDSLKNELTNNIEDYKVITLFFPPEKIEGVYESDPEELGEPTYYDYSFPSDIYMKVRSENGGC